MDRGERTIVFQRNYVAAALSEQRIVYGFVPEVSAADALGTLREKTQGQNCVF
jgi:hypothetical protein